MKGFKQNMNKRENESDSRFRRILTLDATPFAKAGDSFLPWFLAAAIVFCTTAAGMASESINGVPPSNKDPMEQEKGGNDNEQVVRGRSIILIDSRSNKTEALPAYIANELRERYGMTVERVQGRAGSVTIVGLGESIGKIELWDNESFSVIPSSRMAIVPASEDGPEARALFWLALSLVADEASLPWQAEAPPRHYLALSLADALTNHSDGVLCKKDVKAILQAVPPVFAGQPPNPEESLKETLRQLAALAAKGNPKAQYMLAMVAIRSGNQEMAIPLLRAATNGGNQQAEQALKLIQRDAGK